MKTSILVDEAGKRKSTKVLIRADVCTQKRVINIGTASQTENQILESKETSYILLSGNRGVVSKNRSANPSLVSLFTS
jgi:hypothetical protein